MKNPLTPAGIKPTTFRFVAQHLNHCVSAVPRPDIVLHEKGEKACLLIDIAVLDDSNINTKETEN